MIRPWLVKHRDQAGERWIEARHALVARPSIQTTRTERAARRRLTLADVALDTWTRSGRR